MEGGSTGTSSADRTYSPPESKLASGAAESQHRKKAKRGPKKLNRIGRRYQLAAELVAQVPWLRGASIPRIAWIIRHVADAGWTALEVQAIAEQDRPILAAQVRRPSGLLADRLGNLHLLYTTPERRKTAVQAWQDSRIQEQARHAEAAQHADHVQGPSSVSVRNLFREAVRRTRQIATGPVDEAGCHVVAAGADGDLEDLGRELVAACRAEALADPTVITGAIAAGLPELEARQLYTHRLVDQALALEAIAARNATLTPAF
jgi:hypothetical protein